MNELIKKIYDYAEGAHGNQKRKYSGDPYITHCLRVMQACAEYTNDVTILSAALLHDVLEDTQVEENELKHFLLSVMKEEDAEKTIELVVDLTDVFVKGAYPHLNRKARKIKEAERLHTIHPDAQTVKYADIIDNAVDITENDKGFARKYLKEVKSILSGMTEGNQALYKKALEVVNDCLGKI
jgi:(p)ppGpp synthase/HD superfamily hydrolase